MPQILSKEIRNRITSGGENKMYTISDFADLNNDSLVTRVLSRLEEEGMLVRLTQGLYLYPKQTRFGIVKPTPYEIAKAVAGKDHAKVIPSGAMALNELGLSTQIPTNAVFITIVVLYSLRVLAGGISCVYDFRWLQFISSLVPAIIAWCYWPGTMKQMVNGK